MIWISLLLLALVPFSEGQKDIEVYFVVDQLAQELYKDSFKMNEHDMIQEIDYIITEMNKYYAALNIGLTIYKRKLDFLSVPIGVNNDADTVINAFKAWLKKESKYKALDYDIAMLFTGRDLESEGSKGCAGYAYEGGVCNKEYSIGIAELRGGFGAVATVTHEIGHLLGAKHDDPPNSEFIMSPSHAPGKEWLKFSQVSKAYFEGKLRQTNCQTSKSRDSTIPNQSLPSRLNTPDKICKRLHGDSGRMCGSSVDNAGGDGVCSSLQCAEGTSLICSRRNTFNGMICGKEETCKNGRCVTDPGVNTGNAKVGCPYGDVPRAHVNNQAMPCSHWMTKFGSGLCVDIRSQCCKSCDEHATGDPNCPYGDSRINVKGHGMITCGEAIKLGVPCENVKTKCCKTCGDLASGDQKCRYGDKTPQCALYTPAQLCGSVNNRELCCETCKNYRARRDMNEPKEIPVLTLTNEELLQGMVE